MIIYLINQEIWGIYLLSLNPTRSTKKLHIPVWWRELFLRVILSIIYLIICLAFLHDYHDKAFQSQVIAEHIPIPLQNHQFSFQMERLRHTATCHLTMVALILVLLLHLSSCVDTNTTKSANEKINVTIPVLAPLYGAKTDRFAYALAAKYAMNIINNRSDILKDYRLVPKIHDTVVSRLSCCFYNPVARRLC
jgi:hypothetical protein